MVPWAGLAGEVAFIASQGLPIKNGPDLERIHQSHDYQTPDEIYYANNVDEPLAIAA